MTSQWEYMGDVDISYGGYYWQYDTMGDYVDVLRVTDLDSACGSDGLVMIERLVIPWLTNKKQNRQSLSVCGWAFADLRGKGKNTVIAMLVDAHLAYGWYDPVSDMTGPHCWILVTQEYMGNKSSWDGWSVDIEESVKLAHKYNHDLREYVESELLD